MSALTLAIHIAPDRLQLAHGGSLVDIPLERQESGALTEATRQRIVAALREHSQTNGSLFPRRVLCAIGARGLSLRRLTLPAAPREKLDGLVRLQVENEFPVPPDQLAWGWQILGVSGGPAARQNDILVAAVRRNALEEWTALFAEAGMPVSFTPSPLARWAVMAAPAPDCGILDLGQRHSELLILAKGAPSGVRALAWGSETLADASLPPIPERKLFLTGLAASHPEVAALLARLNGAPAQPLLPLAGAVASPTLAALQRLAAGESSRPALLLQSGDTPPPSRLRLPRQWTALAAALALAVLAFPCVEPVLFKAHLTGRLNEIHAEEARLGTLDQELSFFQFLRKTQPPALDVLGLIVQSAPPGANFESCSLTRAGELSLRGKMGNGTDVTDFRTKLMNSGWFYSVAVDEQAQQPDRRVNVRLTASLKPADLRRPLPSASPEAKNGKEART